MPTAYFIYRPVLDLTDQLLINGPQFLRTTFSFDTRGVQRITDLAALSNFNPALLFILGHGNMGAGIGSKHFYYDAGPLVKLLIAKGLALQHQNLTIYLWACNSGVAMHHRQLGIIRHRKPFVERFAIQMQKAGFSGVRVIGFRGFINGQGMTSNTLNLSTGAITNSTGTTLYQNQLAFDVNNGNVVRAFGKKWRSVLDTFNAQIRIVEG